jgi:hypothetical protein
MKPFLVNDFLFNNGKCLNYLVLFFNAYYGVLRKWTMSQRK